MNTEPRRLRVAGLDVEIVRKDIRNLHLGVYPPRGRVRLAVPLVLSDEAARLAVIDKLGWIRKQRARFLAQVRQSEREMVSGETHYFLGQRFRLRVVLHDGKARIVRRRNGILELQVREATDADQRLTVLQDWYRQRLRELVPPLLAKWEARLGVKAEEWGIRRMRTKWGSCNAAAGRIWLNLELAKKPVPCLEYIIVHELVHLSERKHNERFLALLDRHLPNWRNYRQRLNAAPLADEGWGE